MDLLLGLSTRQTTTLANRAPWRYPQDESSLASADKLSATAFPSASLKTRL
jgi:hypothetical protein